jgi:hypothetical protein
LCLQATTKEKDFYNSLKDSIRQKLIGIKIEIAYRNLSECENESMYEKMVKK